MVATDAEGRITFTNPVAEVLSGWSSGSALGRSIDEVLIFCGEGRVSRSKIPLGDAAIRERRGPRQSHHSRLEGRETSPSGRQRLPHQRR